jgi:HPt (histidine-containing phosphotransfer) domain-containing protein
LQRLGGDTELLRELESDFLRQYPQKLRRIILCRDSENWDEAALAAHSLKNIVGAIGAEAARRLAGDLEESLRRSDSDTAERLFGTIKESLRRAEAALGDRAASQPDANAP